MKLYEIPNKSKIYEEVSDEAKVSMYGQNYLGREDIINIIKQ